MKELAKKFIDKECVITSFDGNHQYEGVIKEVTDGAILVEKNGKIEALNLDFVIRIREYPRNKKGKKKIITICKLRRVASNDSFQKLIKSPARPKMFPLPAMFPVKACSRLC